MGNEFDIFEAANRSRAKKEKAREKQRRLSAVWKWIADNIVAVGALIVAIIALVRTF